MIDNLRIIPQSQPGGTPLGRRLYHLHISHTSLVPRPAGVQHQAVADPRHAAAAPPGGRPEVPVDGRLRPARHLLTCRRRRAREVGLGLVNC